MSSLTEVLLHVIGQREHKQVRLGKMEDRKGKEGVGGGGGGMTVV